MGINLLYKSDILSTPKLENWRSWSYEDYLRYFLSLKAAKKRLRPAVTPTSIFSNIELKNFCKPIKKRIKLLYGGNNPCVSIIIPAYNEESELLPTIVSFTRLSIKPDMAELIIVDNNSTDRTAEIIKYCGAKYVFYPKRKAANARAAGFAKSAETAEYIWFVDADTRVIAPLRFEKDLHKKSSILQTSLDYLDQNPDMIGVSTGALFETAHWSYLVIHKVALILRLTHRLSCFSGRNQFIRKNAIKAIGGIDTSVDFRDDQHLHISLARYAKKKHLHLDNANRNSSLEDPVYSSGRRHGSLANTLRGLFKTFMQPKLKRDKYNYPLHPKNVKWKNIRINSSGVKRE